eukprot:1299880-Amphidinium_carterae.1
MLQIGFEHPGNHLVLIMVDEHMCADYRRPAKRHERLSHSACGLTQTACAPFLSWNLAEVPNTFLGCCKVSKLCNSQNCVKVMLQLGFFAREVGCHLTNITTRASKTRQYREHITRNLLGLVSRFRGCSCKPESVNQETTANL